MRVFENTRYERVHFPEGSVFEHIEFKNCHFEGCELDTPMTPAQRTIIRNVRLINCSEYSSHLQAPILDEVLIDGMKSTGVKLEIFGAVFRHVVLKGNIDRIMLFQTYSLLESARERAIAFAEDAANFYKNVDWALDISKGEFKECDLRGVPVSLVRRDPESQVVVTKDRVAKSNWRRLEFCGSLVPIVLQELERSRDSSDIIIAPKRGRNYKKVLADIDVLRRAKVCEKD